MTRDEIEKKRKELDDAEKELIKKEQDDLQKEKDTREKELNSAYDKMIVARNNYYDLRNKFIKDYGYVKVTSKSDDFDFDVLDFFRPLTMAERF